MSSLSSSILTVLLLLLVTPAKSFTEAEMSQFSSVIEQDSCGMNWATVRSIWTNDANLEMFQMTATNSCVKSIPVLYSAPIHYVQFITGATNRLVFDKSKLKKVFNDWEYDKTQLRLFPLDLSTNIFMFMMVRLSDQANLILPVFNPTNLPKMYRSIKLARGAIPMSDLSLKNRKTSFDLTIINIGDYSYTCAVLQIEPTVTLTPNNVYYFGFNQRISSIYFGQSLEILSTKVPRYLDASRLFPDIKASWYGFQYNGYVYLIYDQWVYIFAYVDLKDKLSLLGNTRPIFECAVSVMHINTLFRCANGTTMIRPPTNPSKRIMKIDHSVTQPPNVTMQFFTAEPDDGFFQNFLNADLMTHLMVGGAVIGVIGFFVTLWWFKFRKPSKPKNAKHKRHHKRKGGGNSPMSALSSSSVGSSASSGSGFQSKFGGSSAFSSNFSSPPSRGGGGGSKYGASSIR